MELEILKAIEAHYNITIRNCIPGPRQVVAQTYILGDIKGDKYFCKLINIPTLIPGIVKTLPVVEQMHEMGIDRICYPIRGSTGLHMFMGGALIVLFNYIPTSQSLDYSLYTLGSLVYPPKSHLSQAN